MTAAARKAFSSVVRFLSGDVWSRVTPNEPSESEMKHRVGEHYADYSEPTRKQINEPQPELEELFKNSKVVSVKREL